MNSALSPLSREFTIQFSRAAFHLQALELIELPRAGKSYAWRLIRLRA